MASDTNFILKIYKPIKCFRRSHFNTIKYSSYDDLTSDWRATYQWTSNKRKKVTF